jgi:hypothetical protein
VKGKPKISGWIGSWGGMKLPFRKASRFELLRDDPLRDYFVWWGDISYREVEEFGTVLESATAEKDLQRFFEQHPHFLVQHLHGGHGRWCIPQKRLGAELVPDFVVGERSSLGFEWCAVEIESPTARLFTLSGDPSKHLNHAIRQIIDWRSWLKTNIDYARRPQTDNGLGLTDIGGDLDAVILIGRRDGVDADTRARRRQMCMDLRVRIHTYDWLLDEAVNRCKRLEQESGIKSEK